MISDGHLPFFPKWVQPPPPKTCFRNHIELGLISEVSDMIWKGSAAMWKLTFGSEICVKNIVFLPYLSESIVWALPWQIFKRVVTQRAMYHMLNVITISLYVCLYVCVKQVLGGLDPLLKKMVSEHHWSFLVIFPKVCPTPLPQDPFLKFFFFFF